MLRQPDGRWEGLYSNLGRPSIPPEKSLRALLQIPHGTQRGF